MDTWCDSALKPLWPKLVYMYDLVCLQYFFLSSHITLFQMFQMFPVNLNQFVSFSVNKIHFYPVYIGFLIFFNIQIIRILPRKFQVLTHLDWVSPLYHFSSGKLYSLATFYNIEMKLEYLILKPDQLTLRLAQLIPSMSSKVQKWKHFWQQIYW